MTADHYPSNDEIAGMVDALRRRGYSSAEIVDVLHACSIECAHAERSFAASRFRAAAALIADNDETPSGASRRAAS